MGAYKHLAVFVFLATFTVAVQGGTRYRRDTNDDLNKAIGQAEDDINNFFAKIYGGKCAVANQFTGDQCLSPIAACDTNQGIAGLGGECRPVWWAWLIIGLVALFIIGGFLCCCICCCCSAILDCLCCCCRGQ